MRQFISNSLLTTIKRLACYSLVIGLLAGLPTSSVAAASATSARSSADIREAQTIITKYGIPVGPIDGLNGPNTAQGMCAFRWLAGMTPSRAPLDAATLAKLRDFNSRYPTMQDLPIIYLSNGARTFLVAEQTCQTMFYYANGSLTKVFQISTGRPGVNTSTPNGYYSVKGTVKGWTCSTEYPETCRKQTAGLNASVSNYGNMYNKRLFKDGGFYIHGSNTVPTYPDSGGCIRVSVADADWISRNVPLNTGLSVSGQFVKTSSDRFSYPVSSRPVK